MLMVRLSPHLTEIGCQENNPRLLPHELKVVKYFQEASKFYP